MIRVFLTGRHARRCPLSYAALAPLFADSIRLVERPSEADLYLFAHSLDIREAPGEMVLDWRTRRRPVVLLSEEPFWDTIWTQRPLDRELYIETDFGDLPVIQLNHQTSDIFDYDVIPYYLLTSHRFSTAYRSRFRRNAARSVADWRADFAARAVDLTFMFERRPERHHDARWPEAEIIGLCAWRTDVAELCTAGTVERLGHRWQGGPPRQQLPDWHLDKIMRLDGRARSQAAFENTHHPRYLTEKLFDAFACGSRPLYFASPGHRVHELGLPQAAWLNLYDLDPETAAAWISEPFGDAAFWDAWQAAQAILARLWQDLGLLVQERRRLKRSLLHEFFTLLDAA